MICLSFISGLSDLFDHFNSILFLVIPLILIWSSSISIPFCMKIPTPYYVPFFISRRLLQTLRRNCTYAIDVEITVNWWLCLTNHRPSFGQVSFQVCIFRFLWLSEFSSATCGFLQIPQGFIEVLCRQFQLHEDDPSNNQRLLRIFIVRHHFSSKLSQLKQTDLSKRTEIERTSVGSNTQHISQWHPSLQES